MMNDSHRSLARFLTRRRLIWGLGGLVILAVLYSVMRDGRGIVVDTDTVRRDALLVTVDEQGRTRAVDRYVVAAPITGRLSRTDVREGMHVTAGQPLATVAPAPDDPRARAATRAALAAAEARTTQAEAAAASGATAMEQARRELERRRPLLEMGALSQEAFERYEEAASAAVRRRDAADAALMAARADEAAARARLIGGDAGSNTAAVTEVRAPIDGTVVRVYQESERVVGAGTPLFEIADPGALEVVVDLLSEDAVQVESGAPVRLRDWGGDAVLHGKVRYLEPAAFTKVSALGVEEQRVNVIIDLSDWPATLGSGYRVEAEIVTWQGDDVLSVPTSAMFQREGAWHVFVVDGGRAALRTIEIGHRGTERAEVIRGLEEGDDVVVFPSDLVDDGVRVSPRKGQAGG